MVHVIIVGFLTAAVVTLFVNQIVRQLRSGKVRPRGSEVYKTREQNGLWFWSSIGSQLLVILVAFYLFLSVVSKTSK